MVVHRPTWRRRRLVAGATRKTGCRRMLFTALAGAVLLMAAPANAQDLVIINKLDDLDHGTWSGTGNITRTSRHCVASSAPGNLYSLTITGNGPSGAFEVRNGTEALPYIVDYRDQPGTSFVSVSAGVPLTNLVGQNDPNRCRGQRQRVRVQFQAADLGTARAGPYAGTLTLLVAPI